MELRGRMVVVSGASSGIGRAAAIAFARAGARIALIARRADRLQIVADEIRAAGASAGVYPVDLSDACAVDRAADAILSEMSVPDVIVNCAGSGRFLYVDETIPDEAAGMMAVPYLAAFHLTRSFLPAMLKRGAGRIVNVTSPASRIPWPGATAYCAARWALHGFTSALREDLRGTPLRATLVTLGKTNTEYFQHNPGSEERIPRITKLLPTLTPGQAASAILTAARCGGKEVVRPRLLRILFALHKVCPGLVQTLVTRTGFRRDS